MHAVHNRPLLRANLREPHLLGDISFHRNFIGYRQQLKSLTASNSLCILWGFGGSPFLALFSQNYYAQFGCFFALRKAIAWSSSFVGCNSVKTGACQMNSRGLKRAWILLLGSATFSVGLQSTPILSADGTWTTTSPGTFNWGDPLRELAE